MNLKKLLNTPHAMKIIPYAREWDRRAQVGTGFFLVSFIVFLVSLGFEIDTLMLTMPVLSLLGLWLLSPQWAALMWSLEMKRRRGLDLIYFSVFLQSLAIFFLVTRLIGK